MQPKVANSHAVHCQFAVDPMWVCGSRKVQWRMASKKGELGPSAPNTTPISHWRTSLSQKRNSMALSCARA